MIGPMELVDSSLEWLRQDYRRFPFVLDRAIEMPIDRENRALGSAVIHAEFGAPFDPARPS